MIKKFNEFINESLESQSLPEEGKPVIIITKDINDERNPYDTKITYSVDYQLTIDGELIQISGTLAENRGGNYEFEDDGWWTDEESEAYWDENYEEVNDQIVDEFHKNYETINSDN